MPGYQLARIRGVADPDAPVEIAGTELAAEAGIAYTLLKTYEHRGVIEPRRPGRVGKGNSSRYLSTDIGVLRVFIRLRSIGVPEPIAARAVGFLQRCEWRIWTGHHVYLVVGPTFGPVLAGIGLPHSIEEAGPEPLVVVHLGPAMQRRGPSTAHVA